jgi:hypothetical protein
VTADHHDITSSGLRVEVSSRNSRERSRCATHSKAVLQCFLFISVSGLLYDYGFHSFQFSWDGPGLKGFKVLCRSVSQNSVPNAKCPGVFKVLNREYFRKNVRTFDFLP